jgi:hypothetical protein
VARDKDGKQVLYQQTTKESPLRPVSERGSYRTEASIGTSIAKTTSDVKQNTSGFDFTKIPDNKLQQAFENYKNDIYDIYVQRGVSKPAKKARDSSMRRGLEDSLRAEMDRRGLVFENGDIVSKGEAVGRRQRVEDYHKKAEEKKRVEREFNETVETYDIDTQYDKILSKIEQRLGQGVDISEAASGLSGSRYISLTKDDGRGESFKIRISDHELPWGYGGPDAANANIMTLGSSAYGTPEASSPYLVFQALERRGFLKKTSPTPLDTNPTSMASLTSKNNEDSKMHFQKTSENNRVEPKTKPDNKATSTAIILTEPKIKVPRIITKGWLNKNFVANADIATADDIKRANRVLAEVYASDGDEVNNASTKDMIRAFDIVMEDSNEWQMMYGRKGKYKSRERKKREQADIYYKKFADKYAEIKRVVPAEQEVSAKIAPTTKTAVDETLLRSNGIETNSKDNITKGLLKETKGAEKGKSTIPDELVRKTDKLDRNEDIKSGNLKNLDVNYINQAKGDEAKLIQKVLANKSYESLLKDADKVFSDRDDGKYVIAGDALRNELLSTAAGKNVKTSTIDDVNNTQRLASALAYAKYKDALDNPEVKAVSILGGAPGAGKSIFIPRIAKDVVYETTLLSSKENAIKPIQDALNADKQVSVEFLYRDPAAAIEQVKAGRDGRQVAKDRYIDNYFKQFEVVQDLLDKFGDNNNNNNFKLDIYENNYNPITKEDSSIVTLDSDVYKTYKNKYTRSEVLKLWDNDNYRKDYLNAKTTAKDSQKGIQEPERKGGVADNDLRGRESVENSGTYVGEEPKGRTNPRTTQGSQRENKSELARRRAVNEVDSTLIKEADVAKTEKLNQKLLSERKKVKDIISHNGYNESIAKVMEEFGMDAVAAKVTLDGELKRMGAAEFIQDDERRAGMPKVEGLAFLNEDGTIRRSEEIVPFTEAAKVPKWAVGIKNAVNLGGSKFQDVFMYHDKNTGQTKQFTVNKNPDLSSKDFSGWKNDPIKSNKSFSALAALNDENLAKALETAKEDGITKVYIYAYNNKLGNEVALAKDAKNNYALIEFDNQRHFIEGHQIKDKSTGELLGKAIVVNADGSVDIFAGKDGLVVPDWFNLNDLTLPEDGIKDFARLERNSTEDVIYDITRKIKDKDKREQYRDYLRSVLLYPGIEGDNKLRDEMNAIHRLNKEYEQRVKDTLGKKKSNEFKSDLSAYVEKKLEVDEGFIVKLREDSIKTATKRTEEELGILNKQYETAKTDSHKSKETQKLSKQILKVEKQLNEIKKGKPPKYILREWAANEQSVISSQEVQDSILRKRWGENGVKLAKAWDKHRKIIYDTLFYRINEVLRDIGAPELNYLDDYQTHMKSLKESGLGGNNTLMGVLGDLIDNNRRGRLDATLAGKTEYFQPKNRYLPFAKRRMGKQLPADPVGLLDEYASIGLEVIHKAPAIAKVRGFGAMLEAGANFKQSNIELPETIQKMKGEKRKKATEKFYERVEVAKENAREDTGALKVWTQEMANIMARKTPKIDRVIVDMGGRKILKVAEAMANTVSRANVFGNVGTILKQSVSAVNTISTAGARNTIKAVSRILKDDSIKYNKTLSDNLRSDEVSFWDEELGQNKPSLTESDTQTGNDAKKPLWAESTAMRSLMENDETLNDSMNKVDKILGAPLGTMDKTMKQLQFYAQYYKAKQKGATESVAIKQAEVETNALFQFRNNSNRAQIYQNKTLMSTFLKFTTEASQQIKHFKRMTPKQKTVAVVLAYMMSQGLAQLGLEDAVPNPIGAIVDATGKIIKADEEDPTHGVGAALQGLAGDIIGMFPVLSNLVNTMPEDTRKDLFGSDNEMGRYAGGATWSSPIAKWATAASKAKKYLNSETGGDVDDLTSALGSSAQALGIKGSGQLTKTIQGLIKANDEEADIFNTLKGALFGKNAMSTPLDGFTEKEKETAKTLDAVDKKTYQAALKSQNDNKGDVDYDGSLQALQDKSTVNIYEGNWSVDDEGLIRTKSGNLAISYYKENARLLPEDSDEAYAAYLVAYASDLKQRKAGVSGDTGNSTIDNVVRKNSEVSRDDVIKAAINLYEGEGNEDIPEWVRERYINNVLKTEKLTEDNLVYAAIASYSAEDRLGYITQEIKEFDNHEEVLSFIIENMEKSTLGQRVITSSLIDDLYNEGYISYDERKALKKSISSSSSSGSSGENQINNQLKENTNILANLIKRMPTAQIYKPSSGSRATYNNPQLYKFSQGNGLTRSKLTVSQGGRI